MRSDRYTHETPEKPAAKKNRRILVILLILILLLLAAIAGSVWHFYKTTEDSLSLNFRDDALTLEFGGEYPAIDQVADSTGDVKPASELLPADAVGECSMEYTVTKPILGGLLSPSKTFTLRYSVVDTAPPVTLWNGKGAVLERGSEFDIKNVIAYGDNADPEPEVKVDGKVDMDKNGKYPLHVTVTDASGNSTDWKFTVEVADSVPAYTDDSERVKFGDFISAYKADGASFGIDVSAWQDEIDFDKVKKAGCDFVMIRIGYSENGEMTTDKRFDENIKKAREAGLKIGVYMYSCDKSEKEVRACAGQVIEKLGGEKPDLPVAFDWEDFGHFQTYKVSFHELNGLYDAFADELSKSGYDCMLYGSKKYLEEVWEKTEERPVWLAHYTEKTDYEGPYRMWQASCTGKISGIDGDVDMDIMYD